MSKKSKKIFLENILKNILRPVDTLQKSSFSKKHIFAPLQNPFYARQSYLCLASFPVQFFLRVYWRSTEAGSFTKCIDRSWNWTSKQQTKDYKNGKNGRCPDLSNVIELN